MMTTSKRPPAVDNLPFHQLPVMQAGMGFDLLDGIRVLDLTTSVAGPYSTMLLADMGAEVIKIERPGHGDDSRSWGPPFLEGESLWFLSVNRNKKSLALDYSLPAGLAVLHDLVAKADIVVVNQPPRVAKKLGTDANTLRAIKPDLIYVSITGFGLTGERADWTCYDLIAEGYSGIMDITGEIDGDPQKVGAPAADMLAGQDAAMASLAAIIARGRTGQGRVIDVALVESMTKFLTCRIVPFMGSGDLPRRSGGKDSVIAIYQTFETADEPLTLGLGNDGIWKRFWEVMGHPDIGADPRFASNADRRACRAEIVAMIAPLLRQRGRGEWLALFGSARVPSGPIHRLDEVMADPHLQERGLLYRLKDADHDIPQVGTAFHLDGKANQPRHAPPGLGEHTDALLDELLHYSDQTITDLKKQGII